MYEEPNPSRGEKSDFRKLSVTMPPIAYERLVRESARRKIAGEPNQLLSALVREAVFAYLERLDDEEDGDGHSAVQAGRSKDGEAGRRH
jgi:hypothetical protein